MDKHELAPQKTLVVEYGHGFFKSNCRGCGLETRERVYHFADYLRKDGGPYHFRRLSAPWHYGCHDQGCQDVFCVQQREYRRIDTFGVYIVEVVKALDNMIKTADVPKFLSSPRPELNGLSPIHVIWHHDEWGFRKVEKIIEGAASSHRSL